jgi:hypothetical protein
LLDGAYAEIYWGNIYKKIPFELPPPCIKIPDPGFRAYLLEKGYITIDPVDNECVRITPAGHAATTFNMNRSGYRVTTSGTTNISLQLGGLTSTGTTGPPNCGGFSHVPNIISTANMSDINTALWVPVQDLTGIEYFSNLENLYLNGNDLATLDVSANKKLRRLDAEDNPLTSVIFDNPDLIHVDLVNSQLSTLTVSGSPNLRVLLVTGHETLDCGGGVGIITGGSINGARLIYRSTFASGSLSWSGPVNLSSAEAPDTYITIDVGRPVSDAELRVLFKEHGIDF